MFRKIFEKNLIESIQLNSILDPNNPPGSKAFSALKSIEWFAFKANFE